MNEAGEYIERKDDSGYISIHQAKTAINKALEQVGKEAKEKLTIEGFKVIESSPSYHEGFIDALEFANGIMDKIIKSLKL